MTVYNAQETYCNQQLWWLQCSSIKSTSSWLWATLTPSHEDFLHQTLYVVHEEVHEAPGYRGHGVIIMVEVSTSVNQLLSARGAKLLAGGGRWRQVEGSRLRASWSFWGCAQSTSFKGPHGTAAVIYHSFCVSPTNSLSLSLSLSHYLTLFLCFLSRSLSADLFITVSEGDNKRLHHEGSSFLHFFLHK